MEQSKWKLYYPDTTYTCQILEQISRMSKNTMKDTIGYIGLDGIQHIYEVADVYHCDSPEYSGDFLIDKFGVKDGTYTKSDKVSPQTIGRSLGLMVLELVKDESEIPKMIYDIGTSWWMNELDNYESDLYYQNETYHRECWYAGRILCDDIEEIY